MTACKLTFTVDRFSTTEVLTDACKARLHAQQREAACNALNASGDMGWAPNCVATTGELMLTLQERGLLCLC